MSVLRTIESKLESLFEGVFGRAFRTNVQPVELARKLVKEMDDHRSVSVSRVYVPNEYTIYLSPEDREQFASFEDSLREELQDYLAEHARRERYMLLRLPPACGGAAGRRQLRPRRPRFHERRRGRREAREAARAERRLAVHDRLDRSRLFGGARIACWVRRTSRRRSYSSRSRSSSSST